ncbi:DNA-3-methyladenine glycosylase I [Crossiella equi]|uniref:DNA-3-methyladenine glycosylase I n=1 Tax=Crossiella equi TaxID=130796 RepID=A0ABS5AQN9_9PSEU|nr:DNA-3-methyladenine glycosylase I [Crossiella equi]MBP2478871.1 DNA-3-methyladenine glycosylase I [Crossiella equi]
MTITEIAPAPATVRQPGSDDTEVTIGSVQAGPDGIPRCLWAVAHKPELHMDYHDHEWGQPDRADRTLFEKLSLECFQASLSRDIILQRRPAFRRVFRGFDIPKIAEFTQDDINNALLDPSIIRHRTKVRALVHNAKTLAKWDPGALTELMWSYAPDHTHRTPPRSWAEIPLDTPESTALANVLKNRGLRYVGPRTVYAVMQAAGLVNDHINGCAYRCPHEPKETSHAAQPLPRRQGPPTNHTTTLTPSTNELGGALTARVGKDGLRDPGGFPPLRPHGIRPPA